MPDVARMSKRLSPIAGEFVSSEVESLYQAERLPETVRQIRMLFLLSVIFNSLFFISDWRFHGTAHFLPAVTARSAIVAISLICGLISFYVKTFRSAERLMLLWQLVTAIGVTVLVSSQSSIAFFVVLMLPLIYYLAVPTSFFWTVAAGAGSSLLMLGGYLGPELVTPTTIGLVLAMLMLNGTLTLVVIRANRLLRQTWAATQSMRAANVELAESQDRLEKMFMAVPIPLVATEKASGRVIMFNDAATRFFDEKMNGRQISSISEVYADPMNRMNLLQQLAAHGQVAGFETQLQLGNGTTSDVLLAAAQVDIGGTEVVLAGAIDITRRKAMESRLEQLATTDPLTGLSNRTHFLGSAKAELARTRTDSSRLAVVLLDVDHFKQVNDTLGHDAGDALLKTFAERLRSSVRATDVVARLGGDEFAIILPNLKDDGDVARAVDSIMVRLREPIIYSGRVLECRASIGASIFPVHADNVEDLLKDADIALYVAKTGGRGHMRVFEPEMRSVMQRRSTMIQDAREALAADQILPYYQPKVALASGRINGFEALLRWRHPNRGIQLPRSIAAAFDDPDVAVAISDRMLSKVILDIRKWLDDGVEFGHVGVNASAAEFRQNNFAERVLERLHAAGVPNDRLELEVTETVFLGRGAEYVERALECLSAAGVRIALDDFGTGYASLSHLKKFPVDIIKIDQSFVRDLEDDPDDAAIIGAVAHLGQNLGIGTVAEGIETIAQAQFIAAQGCDCGQGYLFGHPAPAAEVPQILAARAGGGTWWMDGGIARSSAA